LQKSGLSHPQIGRNLYLHPVVPVAAFYPHDIAAWNGPMMTTVVQEFTRLHDNWGFRLECPPVHPGLAASTLPWESAEQYKTDMKRLRHLGVHICLVRDRFGGRVTVGKQSGEPVLHYQLHEYDKRHLVQAMQRSVEAHIAAGAERVSILHNQPLHYFPGKPTDTVASFQEKIAARSWAANRMGLYSAHQMGTCRMGGTNDHPVKPNGETREIKNLYVGDASLFPSASGTNPMLTVKALAWYVGGNILNDE
jgi:choline dehydrogenase-like flavoprotein